MIRAVEQEVAEQPRIAGDRARSQSRRIRALRQAGEDDEVSEISAAEPDRCLESTERRGGLIEVDFRIALVGCNNESVAVGALEDGATFGVRLRWSFEPEALETAGGIATALPLLPAGPVLIVSGDIVTSFDYATLATRTGVMARDNAAPRVHLVMVPNPPYHAAGDFALADGRLALDATPMLTFANIGVYDTALFRELPRGTKLKLLPYLRRWIAGGIVSGERYDGPWANVGAPDDLARLDATLRQNQSHPDQLPPKTPR